MPKLCFASPRDLPVAHPQTGVTERTLRSRDATLLFIDLEARTVIDTHRHDEERVGVITRGSVAMAISGETRILTEGDTFVVPAGAAHGIRVLERGAQVVEARRTA
ncbi:MAG: cupin domain-containing protein [Chloroflexi bacterium]|nr:cupin domain-containing protein [Chloroflexota bacterium]